MQTPPSLTKHETCPTAPALQLIRRSYLLSGHRRALAPECSKLFVKTRFARQT